MVCVNTSIDLVLTSLQHYCYNILVQGEANLKFIFFTMRQLDSSVPSISKMKKFSLPGFTPPTEVNTSACIMCIHKQILITQHFSAGGVPFFVNSPKDIIHKCIGTPVIASALARYPTIRDDILVYATFNTYKYTLYYYICIVQGNVSW